MTSSKKKAAQAAKPETAKVYAKVFSTEVSKVRTLKSGDTFFDLKINGVMIYGCKAVESDKYPTFIGWPQRKGTDGNYYNVCSVFISPEDTEKIIAQVQAIIDKEDEKKDSEGAAASEDIPF